MNYYQKLRKLDKAINNIDNLIEVRMGCVISFIGVWISAPGRRSKFYKTIESINKLRHELDIERKEVRRLRKHYE